MKRKRFYDHEFGNFINIIYILVIDHLCLQLKSRKSIIFVIVINWLILISFYLYIKLDINVFSKKIKIEKFNFKPLDYFIRQWERILFSYIFPSIQLLVVLIIAKNIFDENLNKVFYLGTNHHNFWLWILSSVLILFFFEGIRILNRKIFRWKKSELKDYEFLKEKEVSNINVVDITGMYVSDWVNIVLFLFFIFLIFNNFNFQNTILLLLIIYLFSFLYCIHYLKIKTGKINIKYSLIGALPFGFIFPAYLPQIEDETKRKKVLMIFD